MVCLFKTFTCILYLYGLESLQAAGLLHLDNQANELSPTSGTTPSTLELSLNYHKSSSIKNNTSDDKPEVLVLKDFAIPPKIKASRSPAPIVAKSFAAPESVPSPSVEFDVENEVNADSQTVVSTPNRDISRHRNLSVRESIYRHPFTPATSEPSLGPLSTGLGIPQRGPSSPLFLTPQERRSQQATDDSFWRTMAVHKDDSALPNGHQSQYKGSKRAHMDVENASPESVSSPLDDSPQAVPKRRKKDVEAMRAKVAELQKKRDEVKRAREEAKKKAEEHQVGLHLMLESKARLIVYSESFKSSGPTSRGYSRRWNVRSRRIL